MDQSITEHRAAVRQAKLNSREDRLLDDDGFAKLVAGRNPADLRPMLSYLEKAAGRKRDTRPISDIGGQWHTGVVWRLVEGGSEICRVITAVDAYYAGIERDPIWVIAMASNYDEVHAGLMARGVADSEIYCTKEDYSEADEIARIAGMERVKYVISNPYHFNKKWTDGVIRGLRRRLKHRGDSPEKRQLHLWIVEPLAMTSLQIIDSLRAMDHDISIEASEAFFMPSTQHLVYTSWLAKLANKQKGWSIGIVVDGFARAIHDNDSKQLRQNIQLVEHNPGKKEVWQVLDNTVDLLQGIRMFDSLPRG